jgi:hypothetical protein
MQEKIDLLREMLGQNDRDSVCFDTFDGYMSIPDPDTHGVSMKEVRTGDRAVVLIGPCDQLNGAFRYNKTDKTATLTFTFPMPR